MKSLAVKKNENSARRKQPAQEWQKAPLPFAKHENLRDSCCSENWTAKFRTSPGEQDYASADAKNRVKKVHEIAEIGVRMASRIWRDKTNFLKI